MSIDWMSWPQGNVPSEHRPRKWEDYLVFLRSGLTRVAFLDDEGDWRDITTEVWVTEQWDSEVIRWAMVTPPEEESPAPSPREGAEGSEGEGEGKGAPQWTRGPWEVGNTIGGSIMVFADRAGGNEARGMIASCDAGNYARSPEKGRANANLIKTAPDLYEALDGLVRRLDDHFGGPERSGDWQEQEVARATLARARGEGS